MTSSRSRLLAPIEWQKGKSYQSIKVENADVDTEDNEELFPVPTPIRNKGLIIKVMAGIACCFSAVFVLSSTSIISGPGVVNETKIIAMTDAAKRFQNNQEIAAPTVMEGPFKASKSKKTKSSKSKGSSKKSNKSPKSPKSSKKGSTAAPSSAPTPTPFDCPDGKPFTITLMNMGNNTAYDAAFNRAKARWESIIKCGLTDIGFDPPEGFDWFLGLLSKPFSGPFVDDVLIGYEFKFIDGVGSPNGDILGQALRLYFRPGLGSPISGIMQFDEDNFATETEGKGRNTQ